MASFLRPWDHVEQASILGNVQGYRTGLLIHHGVVVGGAFLLLCVQGILCAVQRCKVGGCALAVLHSVCAIGLLCWLLSSAIFLGYVSSVGDLNNALNLSMLLFPPAGDLLIVSSMALFKSAAIVLGIFLALAAMGFPGTLAFAPAADIPLGLFMLGAPLVSTGLWTNAALVGSFMAAVDRAFGTGRLPSACVYTYISSVQYIEIGLTAIGLAAFLLRRLLAGRLGGQALSLGQASVACAVALGYASPLWTAIGLAAMKCPTDVSKTLDFVSQLDGFAYGIAVDGVRFVAYATLVLVLCRGGGGGSGADGEGLYRPDKYTIQAVPMSVESISDWKPKPRKL